MSNNKCVFCERTGHNIRTCQHEWVYELCEKYTQVPYVDFILYLNSCRSVELSVLMIHVYNASNVSMTKQAKVEYLIQARHAACPQDEEEEEDEDMDIPVYDPLSVFALDNQENYASDDMCAGILIGQELSTELSCLLYSRHMDNHFVTTMEEIVDIYLGIATIVEQHPHNTTPEIHQIITDHINMALNEFIAAISSKPAVENTQQMDVFKNPTHCKFQKNSECPVCYDMISDAKITTFNCAHQLCSDCFVSMSKTRSTENIICPCCRGTITSVMIFNDIQREQFVVEMRTIADVVETVGV